VQEKLGQPMLLENPSTYVAFAETAMSEVAFLREVVRRTGCGLLLDVNNVFVQAVNHGFDAGAYIDAFPVEHVGEIHLGGHVADSDDDGSVLLIDDHGSEVADPVWALYARALARVGPKPTLIEWDNDVPGWEVLFAEAKRADAVIAGRRTNRVAIWPCRLLQICSGTSRARCSIGRLRCLRLCRAKRETCRAAASASTATMSMPA
jgi:uncharacterized protein (UPF0276 family)